MAKTYYFGWTGLNVWQQGTEKAVPFTYAGGYTGMNDSRIWIPRSICIIEEPNQYGNMKIYIPAWFFKNASKDYQRIREIDWGENGVNPKITI